MKARKLRELEEMGVKLQTTARDLPRGPDRHTILQEIGRLRAQVAALQANLPRSTRRAEGEGEMTEPEADLPISS